MKLHRSYQATCRFCRAVWTCASPNLLRYEPDDLSIFTIFCPILPIPTPDWYQSNFNWCTGWVAWSKRLSTSTVTVRNLRSWSIQASTRRLCQHSCFRRFEDAYIINYVSIQILPLNDQIIHRYINIYIYICVSTSTWIYTDMEQWRIIKTLQPAFILPSYN